MCKYIYMNRTRACTQNFIHDVLSYSSHNSRNPSKMAMVKHTIEIMFTAWKDHDHHGATSQPLQLIYRNPYNG